MPAAIPRPEPRLLTPLPTLDSADERGQQRKPAVFHLYGNEMSEPTTGSNTLTTCKAEQGAWGMPDSSCNARTVGASSPMHPSLSASPQSCRLKTQRIAS
eukprot:8844934-Alexandrium_andersonii.AAC.1